jgi:hypothetical protein
MLGTLLFTFMPAEGDTSLTPLHKSFWFCFKCSCVLVFLPVFKVFRNFLIEGMDEVDLSSVLNCARIHSLTPMMLVINPFVTKIRMSKILVIL